MQLLRIAAFSDGETGGNPAGVAIAGTLPPESSMQRIAAEVGYSETAFAAPLGDRRWRVRYFAPEIEVPFCGHATIALGAVLALRCGDGVFPLQLNSGAISVEGRAGDDGLFAALQSPPTHSAAAPRGLIKDALALFGYTDDDLDPRLPPARMHAGADHLLLALMSRQRLAAMSYNFSHGRALMADAGLTTIALIYARDPQTFDARNAFAVGGVVEDPATGAAAGALAGYLRDLQWPHCGSITIIQGEDMGCRSILRADIPEPAGSSIRVSGAARSITAPAP